MDDLNQSEEESEAKAPVKKMASMEDEDGEWVSGDDMDEEVGKSWEETRERPQVQVDETAALADKLYSLEDRLAIVDQAEGLEVENEELRGKLQESVRLLEEKDKKIRELKNQQLEVLQAIAALKKNTRDFRNGILRIVDSMPPEQAAESLSKMVHELVNQSQAMDAQAEEREFNNDAAVLASIGHPIEKLMQLSHNINPLEASFMLVRWFCRLEGRFAAPNAPLIAVLIDKGFRFWEMSGNFQLYPLYSVLVTHFRSRVQRVGESTPHLCMLLTNLCMLFYIFRSEFDASESTDVVLLKSMQAVLLGLDGGETQMTSISGKPLLSGHAGATQERGNKLIVKTKRALWVELRKLVVLAFALIVRNEGEQVESCIKTTLESIRSTRGPTTYDDSEKCSEGMLSILKQFDALLERFSSTGCPRAVSVQVFGQLCSLVNGHCCNSLMLRRSYATMNAAAAFRGDVRHLEEWIRKNIEPGAVKWMLEKLAPLNEIINVLFMKKTHLTRPEIRAELCSHITTSQLCQILSTYEPQKGEEPVPLALIESMMDLSKSHQSDINSVLIDVTLLDPIDLSVQKPAWLTILNLIEIKQSPLPDDLCEEFILFREKLKRSQEQRVTTPPKK